MHVKWFLRHFWSSSRSIDHLLFGRSWCAMEVLLTATLLVFSYAMRQHYICLSLIGSIPHLQRTAVRAFTSTYLLITAVHPCLLFCARQRFSIHI